MLGFLVDLALGVSTAMLLISGVRLWLVYRSTLCAGCGGQTHLAQALGLDALPHEPPIAIVAGRSPRRVRHEIETLCVAECCSPRRRRIAERADRLRQKRRRLLHRPEPRDG